MKFYAKNALIQMPLIRSVESVHAKKDTTYPMNHFVNAAWTNAKAVLGLVIAVRV